MADKTEKGKGRKKSHVVGDGAISSATDRLVWWSCALLSACSVSAAFSRLLTGPRNFIEGYDDPENFHRNPLIDAERCFLSLEHIARVFFKGVLLGVYEPISLMFRLFMCEAGMPINNALAVARVNTALHCANTILSAHLSSSILETFRSNISSRRRSLCSLLAATLVALHPLRVEVVAWSSCQPYLLSGFFALIAVILHMETYAVKRSSNEATRTTSSIYAFLSVSSLHTLSLVFYTLSVFSKGAAVSLPVVYIALDVEKLSLRRPAAIGGVTKTTTSRRPRTFTIVCSVLQRRRVSIALSAVFAIIITILTRKETDGIVEVHDHRRAISRFLYRTSKGLYASLFYLWKSIWPFNLSMRYPVPYRGDDDSGSIPGNVSESLETLLHVDHRAVALSAVVATIISIVLLSTRSRVRSDAALLWFTYLAMLCPTFLSGHCSMLAADRYTYLPSIFLGVPSLAAVLARATKVCDKRIFAALAALVLILLGRKSFEYVDIWGNEETLWTAMIRINPRDAGLHVNLGTYYISNAKLSDALSHLDQALAYVPHDDKIHNQKVAVLLALGEKEDACQAIENAARDLTKESLSFAKTSQIALHSCDRAEGAHDVFEKYGRQLETSATALSLECDSLRRIGRLVDAEWVCRRATSVANLFHESAESATKARARLLLAQLRRRTSFAMDFRETLPHHAIEMAASQNDIAPVDFVPQRHATNRGIYDGLLEHVWALPADRRVEARTVFAKAFGVSRDADDVLSMALYSSYMLEVGWKNDAEIAIDEMIAIGCQDRSLKTGDGDGDERQGISTKRHGVLVSIALSQPQVSLSTCRGILANSLATIGRLEESARLYEMAITSSRDEHEMGEHLFNLGATLGEMKRWVNAMRAFERAVEARPDLSDAHCYLGGIAHAIVGTEGGAFARQRLAREGIAHFEECFRGDSGKRAVYGVFYDALRAEA